MPLIVKNMLEKLNKTYYSSRSLTPRARRSSLHQCFKHRWYNTIYDTIYINSRSSHKRFNVVLDVYMYNNKKRISFFNYIFKKAKKINRIKSPEKD